MKEITFYDFTTLNVTVRYQTQLPSQSLAYGDSWRRKFLFHVRISHSLVQLFLNEVAERLMEF